MTQEELNRMVRESGLGGVENWETIDALVRSAYAAGVAAEREACAKAVEDCHKRGQAVVTYAAAIRARRQE